MNSWKTKNNKKREDRLILTLHPALLLQYSPVCNFYFPGSPLCFSSRRLRLSVPPVSSPLMSFLPPMWDVPLRPSPLLSGPAHLSTGSPSCLKRNKNTFKKRKQTNTSSECVYMQARGGG